MKKVLVVEDDEDILFIATIVLTELGYTVVADVTGENVHQIIATEQPGLVLLDVQLPKKNGETICCEIKAAADVPVVLFSANANGEGILNRCGANAFLAKPFELEDMEKTVTRFYKP